MPKFEPVAGRGLHTIENAPIPEIRALQLERMKWSLAHAYAHVPVYRQLFDQAGVHPSDLCSLDDLQRFPFTSKAELRDNYPFGMFAVPREQVVRVHASSGTTGKPTVVGYTQSDLDMWSHVFQRSLVAAGVRPGDVVHVAYGYGLFTGGLGAHYGAEQFGCTVVPASVGQTARQVQLLVDFDADVLCATPSYALVVADEFRNQGIDPASTSLRVGIFGAEPWSEAMRAELEDAFGIDAVDIYGLSEVIDAVNRRQDGQPLALQYQRYARAGRCRHNRGHAGNDLGAKVGDFGLQVFDQVGILAVEHGVALGDEGHVEALP